MTDEQQLIQVFNLLGEAIDPETGNTSNTSTSIKNKFHILIIIVRFFTVDFLSFLK